MTLRALAWVILVVVMEVTFWLRQSFFFSPRPALHTPSKVYCSVCQRPFFPQWNPFILWVIYKVASPLWVPDPLIWKEILFLWTNCVLVWEYDNVLLRSLAWLPRSVSFFKSLPLIKVKGMECFWRVSKTFLVPSSLWGKWWSKCGSWSIRGFGIEQWIVQGPTRRRWV